MEILTYAEALVWAPRHLNHELVSLPGIHSELLPHVVRYVTPLEARRLKVLADRSLSLFGQTGLFLWIYDCEDWSWQEAETFPVFDACRRTIGETRSVLVAPAHVATADELDCVSCLLQAVLFYSWQAVICDAQFTKLLKIGDGVFSFSCSKREDLIEAREYFGNMELREF